MGRESNRYSLGDTANLCSGNIGYSLCPFRCVVIVDKMRLQFVETDHPLLHECAVVELAVNDMAHHRQHKRKIGMRLRSDPLVCLSASRSEPGIDDNEFGFGPRSLP